jgi:hypothetical protein
MVAQPANAMADPDVRWLQRAVAITNERALSELADQGVSGISGSRDAVVRELLTPGSEATWMGMIRSRNLTSHTYNPALAREIAEMIVERYAPAVQELQSTLASRARQR